MMETVDRFDTGDGRSLVGLYEQLIRSRTCDSFEDSGEAVDAYEAGDWPPHSRKNLITFNGLVSWHCWQVGSFQNQISE